MQNRLRWLLPLLIVAAWAPAFAQPSLRRPNVLHNVIAHETGHALGLEHNSEPTTLMCGRPAPCRAAAFASDEPRMFPLTGEDIARLRELYPAH